MKAVTGLILAGALVSLATGCSGKASPEADVTCVNSSTITFPGPGTGFVMVQKGIIATDSGLGGEVPANGITASVKSPVDFIQICAGDCLDGSGSFDVTQDVETDDDGTLQYTLGIQAPAAPASVDILELFSSTSQCITTVTAG